MNILLLMIWIQAPLGLANSLPTVAEYPPVYPPEKEVAQAMQKLKNLGRQIKASMKAARQDGMGNQQFMIDGKFKSGSEYLRQQYWHSAVRDLNLFLSSSQNPNPAMVLQAHYDLGKAYRLLRKHRLSAQHNMIFLSQFLASEEPNYDQLVEVMEALLDLLGQGQNFDPEQATKTLSALMSLDLPQSVKPKVYFMAGETALKLGRYRLAKEWLERSQKEKPEDKLLAKVHYFLGTMALRDKDYKSAADHFNHILELKSGELTESYQLARLALARIAVHRREPKIALPYYLKIPQESDSFRSALFERIYVLVDLKRDKEAAVDANMFVSRYPVGRQSFQIKTMLAYLDIRAGDYDKARQRIERSEGELDQLVSWLRSSMIGLEKVSYANLEQIIQTAQEHVRISALAQTGDRYFRIVNRLKEQLNDIRGETRDVIYTMGFQDMKSVRPAWLRQIKQMESLAKEVLEVGHRVVASERVYYGARLSEVEKFALEQSEENRVHLLDRHKEIWRRHRQWRSWVGLVQESIRVGQLYQKVNFAEASLTSMDGYVRQQERVSEGSLQEISYLKNRVNVLRSALLRALEVIRTSKIENLAFQSPHWATKEMVKKYALSVHTDSQMVNRVRQEETSKLDRLLASESAKMWEQWEFIIKLCFKGILDIGRHMREDLAQWVKGFDDQIAHYERLHQRAQSIEENIEQLMGKAVTTILTQLESEVSQRKAQHQKWLADLEWISYDQSTKQQDNLNRDFELQREILRSQLR